MNWIYVHIGELHDWEKRWSTKVSEFTFTVYSEALVIETVHLCDLSTFVVATSHRDTLLVADFKGHQQRDRSHRVVATVNVISHKQIVGLGGFPSDSEKLK